MSRLTVREGIRTVHTGDERVWAVDVSAITTSPGATGTVQVFDESAGGADVTTALVSSNTLLASGTNVVLPKLGGTAGTGWIAGHTYRLDYKFNDGTSTLERSVRFKCEF